MVSCGLNFHSSYTNSTSYESWHFQLNFETLVRSLRPIVWSQEVTEVTEVKMKKKYAKIVKSPIFDSQKCNIPQKKPHENRHSDLKWNYRVLEWKSWKKKIDFVIFDPKNSLSRLGLGWISGKPVKELLDYLLVEMFMDKIKNRLGLS